MSPRAHNPAARWTSCEKCGHRGYHTRGDAKVVRKRHHGAKGMAVFACPHTEGLFHVGYRPNALSSGDRSWLVASAGPEIRHRNRGFQRRPGHDMPCIVGVIVCIPLRPGTGRRAHHRDHGCPPPERTRRMRTAPVSRHLDSIRPE